MEKTDAVIVGGGPAGSLVAARLADSGYHVILLEKRPRIGIPVRCGEATGSREELSRFIAVDESWICADINGIRLIAPGGEIIERRIPQVGVVLDRAGFDRALADFALDRGADVRLHSEATGLLKDDGRVTGVRVRDHSTDRSYDIGARITIGADGVEGFVARWAGLSGHLKPDDIHTAVQYRVQADALPKDTIELYAGRRIAPGGYAWIFPKGDGRANVGLGIHPLHIPQGTAKDLLDRFVAQRMPGARILDSFAGGTSGTKPLKTMVGDGVLLTGEAARQNNPLSGGGIMNALEGADEASAVICEGLRAGDISAGRLAPYNERWHKKVGRSIARLAAMRKFFYSLEDKDIDSVARMLQHINRSRNSGAMDYIEVFKTAFVTAPGLIWKARSLIW
jgi:digeranylgeranylglycerophospholipid reductase